MSKQVTLITKTGQKQYWTPDSPKANAPINYIKSAIQNSIKNNRDDSSFIVTGIYNGKSYTIDDFTNSKKIIKHDAMYKIKKIDSISYAQHVENDWHKYQIKCTYKNKKFVHLITINHSEWE